MSVDPIILLTLRLMVMVLFASAVAHKLWSRAEFERTLSSYLQGLGMGGRGLIKPLFVMVIALEFTVLGLCLIPSASTAAGLVASGTLLLYTMVMAANLLRGNVIHDCGCSWGKSRQVLHPALLVRNAVLALMALALTLPAGNRELGVVDILSVALATMTAGLLYISLNKILSLGFTELADKS